MTQLTVMTWNVQNLFRPESLDDRDTYVDKLGQLAAVIDQVAPDVLALQEIGDPQVMDDLDSQCSTGFPHRVAGRADERGIRVALLSQFALTDVVNRDAFPGQVAPVQVRDLSRDDPDTSVDESVTDRTSRGVLSASLQLDGGAVTVATCHLKSKLISYPPRRPGGPTRFAPDDEGERLRYAGYAVNRRTAEAMTCRALLVDALTRPGNRAGEGDGAGRGKPVILLGDLNDEPRAATTQILLGPGGSEIDFRPGSGFQRPDAGDGWRLWNLHRLLPSDGPSGTRIYRGRPELIDHILASHRLVNPDSIPTVEIVPATPLPSMSDDPTIDHPAPSDHAAVVATFTL